MNTPLTQPAYNDRLFRRGLRKRWHLARFIWLRERLEHDHGPKLAEKTMVELGCFDAKTLDHIHIRPRHYMGYDAGWGGGLDFARQRFANDSTVELAVCTRPEQLVGVYDLSICLETLEHLPLAQLNEFLGRLAAAAPILYASVPVELGPVFFAKHAFKTLTRNRPDHYRFGEFLAASAGRMTSVERIEGVHKGFDYRDLIRRVQVHFPNVQTYNLHLPGFPLWLSGGVGIVASRS